MGLAVFEAPVLEAICNVLGDTDDGLTGTQIGRLLQTIGIPDSDISTKRLRLLEALSRAQTRARSGEPVRLVIEQAMSPVAWTRRRDQWSRLRERLDEVLGFASFALDDSGLLVDASKRSSLDGIGETTYLRGEPSLEELAARRRRETLTTLLQTFEGLSRIPDRQAAGLAFERLLTLLFDEFDLRPRGSIRVVGEQIDGSFHLDGQTYLLEAKWTGRPVSEEPLLAFRGKIQGKSDFTRGLFISVTGFTIEAQAAITRGKSPNFAMMDGGHLYRVLTGDWELSTLLRHLVRALSETGEPYVPVGNLVGLIDGLPLQEANAAGPATLTRVSGPTPAPGPAGGWISSQGSAQQWGAGLLEILTATALRSTRTTLRPALTTAAATTDSTT